MPLNHQHFADNTEFLGVAERFRAYSLFRSWNLGPSAP